METEDQHKSRLEQIDRLKTEAAAKEKKEKEKAEADRKAKVAEEIHKLEEAARLEKEQKEQRRKQEKERLRKEAEAWHLKAEETRLRLEEEAAAKAKAEAISESEPEEREEVELEAHKGTGKRDGGKLEDGRDVDTETIEDGKDRPEDSLRINTISIHSPTSDKRRPGPLDLASAIRSASPFFTALAAARVITDIASVSYPEGYHSPHPDLNRNVKNGKFRCH